MEACTYGFIFCLLGDVFCSHSVWWVQGRRKTMGNPKISRLTEREKAENQKELEAKNLKQRLNSGSWLLLLQHRDRRRMAVPDHLVRIVVGIRGPAKGARMWLGVCVQARVGSIWKRSRAVRLTWNNPDEMRMSDQSAAIKLAICDDIGDKSYNYTDVARIWDHEHAEQLTLSLCISMKPLAETNQVREKLTDGEYREFVNLMKALKSKAMCLQSIINLFSAQDRLPLISRFKDYIPAKYHSLHDQYLQKTNNATINL
ncbi:RAD3-like DNA-binding helicase protein [Artemisia annua]|uniref:RAD3-like DNA-binding helicase protein n=1 Tax=Artemisia annua TaxID=35608 RepID=A0A2U1MUK2_ARTAN|nr:RAD3-like DNA-binding helicase protein [Artemisia annua]